MIGPNGAGKSTVLKLLTRIMQPTVGECRLRGRVGALIEVAAGFHPDLTGRENVFLQGGVNGMLARSGDPASYIRALEALIADRALRERLGVAARDTLEASYTDTLIAGISVDHYLECLGARPNRI